MVKSIVQGIVVLFASPAADAPARARAEPEQSIDPEQSRYKTRPARFFFVAFLVYLVVVLLLQWNSGIYRTELSHQPDESAHVVTSLMIRDYVATGLGESPMRFAENYYLHYPKVAFGMWPPLFHSTAAVWMLLFTRTHTSLVIFIACQCALCAAILALFCRRLLPASAAFGLGLLMVLLPAFQDAASTIMVDIFLTFMQLLAMLAMIAFFRSPGLKTALWFGGITSLAMLTKGNANALVLAGVFMLLLTRQFSLLKRPPVYVAAAVVAIFGMPWQFISLHLLKSAVPMGSLTLSRFWMMFSSYARILAERLSLPLLLVALVGLAVACIPLVSGRRKASQDLDVAGAGALLGAIFLFHCITTNSGADDRYMLPALPLLLVFFALGIRWIASRLAVPRLSLAARSAILATLCLGWFAKSTFALAHRPELGFEKAARALQPAQVGDEVVLVCSDSWGEGALITSIDLGDRPGYEHVVLRGSKILSENPWLLTSYHPYFSSPAQLESYLEQTPVDAVVLDLSSSIWEKDQALLMQTMHDNPARWSLALEIPADADGRHLQLYRWIGADHSNVRKNVRVQMRFTLGHDLLLK